MRRIETLLLLALVIALLAGCGAGGATPSAAQPTATSASAQRAEPVATGVVAQPSATEEADEDQPAATETMVVAQPAATEEESLDLENREDALKDLKSYRASWSYSWTGQKDGKDQTVEWVVFQEYTAEPEASHMRMHTSDSLNPDQAGRFELIQIGQKSYMLNTDDGKENCTIFSSEDGQAADDLVSAGSFGSIRGGRYLGDETVNGIRTKHYRYDEKATNTNLYTRLTGDVWVAVAGGYAVKDVAEWEGGFLGATTDETDPGKGSWNWELTDVNQPFAITAPSGCESDAEDMPIMADATGKSIFGDMITYKTKSKLADAVKFYQAEMPKAGWTAEGDAMVSDSFANLSYAKDGMTANVMLSPDGEDVTVMISVQK